MKYTKEQCEKKISKWKKRLEDCNKLEVGKWYKDGKALVYCRSFNGNVYNKIEETKRIRKS